MGLLRIRIISSTPSARTVEGGGVFLEGDFDWKNLYIRDRRIKLGRKFGVNLD